VPSAGETLPADAESPSSEVPAAEESAADTPGAQSVATGDAGNAGDAEGGIPGADDVAAQPEGRFAPATSGTGEGDAGESEAFGNVDDDGPVVRAVSFQPIESRHDAHERANIDLLLDVKLPVTVELGRTEVPVKDILEFGPGSVIELSKEANEPVDLFVNGVLVARGEVVVSDDRFGIRLTSLISPEERIMSLGGAA